MYKVEKLTKNYEAVEIFSDFSLEFPRDRITVILGPSGCGKTTLLNILAGMITADGGVIGEVSRVSYLFQEPRLMPWLTVRQNLALVLEDKLPRPELEQQVTRYLDLVGLNQYANYYPAQLSGGLRQRVALARAYCYQAPLLLMDEPFKSLDLKIRFKLIEDFIGLWQREPRTVVMVTHDIREATLLGDKIVVLSEKPTSIVFEMIVENPRQLSGNSAERTMLEETLYRTLLA